MTQNITGLLTWNGIIEIIRNGNPLPPHRDERSAADWQAVLTPEQFYVTRQKGTEHAFSSAMCAVFEPGRYACACCGTELFDAQTKFDSGSGWPSFTQAIAPGLVNYILDSDHGTQRVETTCAVCDAHLGHVFPDGPAPSGLRYCINALALKKLA
ncbi:MAG: peptide-methionine (R)-S-oxide reductase MsrB [Azonexus sp.]|nr:peptide-methionine (R)-S-oxide reductase MsrB [Azonexus sp.]